MLALITTLSSMLVCRFDPKPEKRATDKLSLARQAWSCGRDRGGHAGGEEGTYGRADLAGLAAGGGRQQSGRHLPRTRNQRSDVLHLEEEVLRAGAERAARAAAVARGELEAQALGRGSLARP